jgi:predicted HTH transcriptional regulator
MDILNLLSFPEEKILVAFTNTASGIIIVGRADDGSIVGVDDVQADEERLGLIRNE